MARSLSSIMSSVTEMSNDVADVDAFVMLYSEFGMGKTVTIMGLAQELRGDGDILFCDSSDGWVSLMEFPELMEGVDRLRVADPADLIVVANGLDSKKMKSKRGNPFTVVVIDEASSVFDVMLENFIREKHGLSPDDQLPEIEGKEYGPPTAALESVMRKFHDISGVHLLVTAHAREIGETKELRPSFPPKAYAVMMRKLQVCGALSARRKNVKGNITYERSVQLLPSAAVTAKSRIPGSPLKTDTASFIELVSEWVGSDEFVASVQEEADDQELVEDEYEEPEELDTDDVEEEDEITEEDLRAGLKAMSVSEIREWALADYDIDLAGVKKADAIERLVVFYFGEETGE